MVYNPKTIRDDLRAGSAEFIATMLFIFVGNMSVVSTVVAGKFDVVNISLAYGLMIVIMVAVFADISGGHINPAVTWAMIITQNISVQRGVIYIGMQVFGAIIGNVLIRIGVGPQYAGSIGVNKLNTITAWEGFICELTFTFILVMVVFHVAVKKTDVAGSAAIAPLYIGFAVLIAHLGSVNLTGTGINPARSFGAAIVHGEWADHWIYWIGPLLGATLAPLTFRAFYGVFKPESVQIEASGDSYDLDGASFVVKPKGVKWLTEQPRKEDIDLEDGTKSTTVQ